MSANSHKRTFADKKHDRHFFVKVRRLCLVATVLMFDG